MAGGRIRLVAVALVVVAAGCGGKDSLKRLPDAGPFSGGLVADFANAWLPLLCQYDVRCRGADSVEHCRADLVAFWKRGIDRLQDEIDRGHMTYDSARAIACLQTIQTAPCPSSSNGLDYWSLGCAHVFRGSVAFGQPCVANSECAGGYCDFGFEGCSSSCCAGICKPFDAVGSRCSGYGAGNCGAEAYCGISESVNPWSCRLRGVQGEACMATVDSCQVGLSCDRQTQTCVPYPKDGQPCSDASGIPCDNFDSFCEPMTHTCQARREVGAPCVNDACVGYASCANGICVRRPSAGERCQVPTGSSDYEVCRWSFTRCIDGTCQLPSHGPACSIENAGS